MNESRFLRLRARPSRLGRMRRKTEKAGSFRLFETVSNCFQAVSKRTGWLPRASIFTWKNNITFEARGYGATAAWALVVHFPVRLCIGNTYHDSRMLVMAICMARSGVVEVLSLSRSRLRGETAASIRSMAWKLQSRCSNNRSPKILELLSGENQKSSDDGCGRMGITRIRILSPFKVIVCGNDPSWYYFSRSLLVT